MLINTDIFNAKNTRYSFIQRQSSPLKYNNVSNDTVSFTAKIRKLNSGVSNIDMKSQTQDYIKFLKQLNHIPCPCCGKILISKDKAIELSNSLLTLKGNGLTSELKVLKPILPKPQQILIDRINKLAKVYPNNTIHDHISHLYNNTTIFKNRNNIVIDKYDSATNFLKEQRRSSEYIIQQINHNLSPKFNQKFSKEYSYSNLHRVIFGKNTTLSYQRNKFIEYVSNEYNSPKNRKGNDFDTLGKILYVSKQLADEDSIRLYILIENCFKNPHLLVNKFIQSNMATIDHTIPLSKDGKNEISNVMLMCNDCNNKKGTTSLGEFLETKTDVEIHMRTHIEALKQYFSGNLDVLAFNYINMIESISNL